MQSSQTGDTIQEQKATVNNVKMNATKTKIVAALNAEPLTVPGGKQEYVVDRKSTTRLAKLLVGRVSTKCCKLKKS